MQLGILLIKDLKALFKQKAVIFTLLIPTFLIIGIGVLPALIGVNQPFEVAYLNEDQGLDINLGDHVIQELQNSLKNRSDIELVELTSMEDFEEHENAIWFPSNFSQVANDTGNAQYFIKYSDSDLRANSIMNSVVANEIETIVREKILQQDLPEVEGRRVYSEDQQSTSEGERENRAALAFPLAYMAFLILILSSSSMRITGFSAEKEAGMMELLLSAVIDRKELVMSKLLTGVIYGLASVASYAVGLLVLFLVQGNGTSTSSEVSFLVIDPQLISPSNLLIIFIMFADLAFIGIQILLAAQLALGREAGDRLGSLAMMILSFLFYFSAIGDPLSQNGLQIFNPFFWPFRLALNAIFLINPLQSLLYLGANILFSVYLIRIMTKSIEKEDVLFE